MKFLALIFCLLSSLTATSQNYYTQISDFFTYESRIEIYDTSQSAPRIQIFSSPSSSVDDARITKDGYFAYRGGIDGISDVYYFLGEHFDLVDSLVHPKSGLEYENIDGHCVYKDDSLTIYVLEKIVELPIPVFLNDFGYVNHVLDNIIIARKNGVTILESPFWGNFSPKMLLVEVIDTIVTWDVAHINSVEWDGSGVIVSSRCYGIYKIDLTGAIVWEQDSLVFDGPIPAGQHDLQYLGNGMYSVFSNGDNANPMFAATFHFVGDTVVYDYLHLPRLIPSAGMGNYQHNGIVNYGAHEAKFVFPDTTQKHGLAPNEYAYRAAMHNLNIAAEISHVGDSLKYTPLNEYSSYTWSNGEIGAYIDYTNDTISVTEITPLGFVVYTERYFGPVIGISEIESKQKQYKNQSFNILGQPCEPKGLYIKNGKTYYTPK